MRFLVDASLSPVVARVLEDAGHDAIHIRDVLDPGASDDEVLDLAATEQRVLVVADTDFGELLAQRASKGPSVILFRLPSPRRPLAQAELLIGQLPAVEDDLAAGAMVVIEPTRIRVRRLPIDE